VALAPLQPPSQQPCPLAEPSAVVVVVPLLVPVRALLLVVVLVLMEVVG